MGSFRLSPTAFKVLFLVILAGHAALSISHALTLRPWSDEGAMANPAYDLMTRGSLGTTLWEESQWPGIHHHTYYIMPLYALAQAAWYKLTGVSLLSMRLLSLLFALVALGAFYLFLRCLSFGRETAVLGLSLLAFDYVFLLGSSFGRMDMMAAMLGIGSLAAFLALREKNLLYALAVSASLSSAAVFTHPMAIVHFFALTFLVLYLDWARIRPLHVLVAAAPFLLGAGLFGWYISRDSHSFAAQFAGNAKYMGRLDGMTSPLWALKDEFVRRYLLAYGLGAHSTGHSGPIILKSLALLGYLVGVIGCLCLPEVRGNRLYRIPLLLIPIYYIGMSLIDGTRNTYYLVHITPLLAAALALFASRLIVRGWMPVWLVGCGLLGVAAIQAGGIVYKVRLNTYANRYMPAVQFLKQHMQPNSIVMGTSAFAFDLGFDRTHLRDDAQLGYQSGVMGDFVVVDEIYVGTFAGHILHRPPVAIYVERLLATEYRNVYDRNEIVIYERVRPSAVFRQNEERIAPAMSSSPGNN